MEDIAVAFVSEQLVEELGSDVDGQFPQSADANARITAAAVLPEKAVEDGAEHSEVESQGWSFFGMLVRADKSWETVGDREARLCLRFAARLNRLPTLPADRADPMQLWTAVGTGAELLATNCAFKWCMWSSPLCSYSRLQAHLFRSRGHDFLNVSGAEAGRLQLCRYSGAIASIEREEVLAVGCSIDGRAFAGIAGRFADEKLVARICFFPRTGQDRHGVPQL